MVPWQMHQIKATGGLVPTVYEFSRFRGNSLPGIARWARSWLIWPQDVGACHCYRGAKYFDRNVPTYAFRSQAEMMRLRALCIAQEEGDISLERLDKEFQSLGDRQYRETPFRCRVVLPTLRSLTVWLQRENLWPAQLSYVGRFGVSILRNDVEALGAKRALQRLGKAVYSTAVAASNVAVALLFLWLMYRGVRSKHPIALAIVAGVAVYSLVGALQASHEVRRNLLFYPSLLYLSAFVPHRRERTSAGCDGVVSE
jgi:hypothetical protein